MHLTHCSFGGQWIATHDAIRNVMYALVPKICKYIGLHEGHHFIPMAMEVHDTLGHDMYHLIKVCVRLFHNRQSKGHLSLSFCIQFF